MKKFIVLAGLALIAATPALARSQHRHNTAPATQNEPVGTEAYGAQNYGRTGAPAARGHIIVDGVDQGTDPDPLVRMQILRDPPIGGSGS
jgi:hypothetical protein